MYSGSRGRTFPSCIILVGLLIWCSSYSPAVAQSSSSTTTGSTGGSVGASSTTTGSSRGSFGTSSITTGSSGGSVGTSSITTGSSGGSVGTSSITTGSSGGSVGASSTTTSSSTGSVGASSTTTSSSKGSVGTSSITTGSSGGSVGASSTTTSSSGGSVGASSTTTSSSGGSGGAATGPTGLSGGYGSAATSSTSSSTTQKNTKVPGTSTIGASSTAYPGKPTVPPSYQIENVPSMPITTSCQIKSGLYNKSLNEQSSPYYKDAKENVSAALNKTFSESRFGTLETIEITSLNWSNDGIVDVDFTLIYRNVSLDKLRGDLNSTIYKLNPDFFNASSFDSSYTEAQNSGGTSGLCQGQLNTCPVDYNCTLPDPFTPTCVHKCLKYDKCLNGGFCVLNTEREPACRCQDDGNFVYGGEFCAKKAETLALSKEQIIGISAGVGGGVILLLIIIIIIICQRKSLKKRHKEVLVLDNSSEQSYNSVRGSEDGITRQPGNTASYDNPTFRLSEERAENPRYNPYLPRPHFNLQTAPPQDNSQGFLSTNRRVEERQRDQFPNYKHPLQLPQHQDDPLRSNMYQEDFKPHMSHPTRSMQPVIEYPQRYAPDTKVFDYYRPNNVGGHDPSRPHNNTDLYDFENENTPELGIKDPYSYNRRPVESIQRQF